MLVIFAGVELFVISIHCFMFSWTHFNVWNHDTKMLWKL